jgi:hypothetical protein
MIIKCVVACMSTEGADFYFCRVKCAQDDYDNGVHYEIAEDAAGQDGYERPMVTFDENDGPEWLFEHFVWASAETVTSDDVDEDYDEDDEDDEENEEETSA